HSRAKRYRLALLRRITESVCRLRPVTWRIPSFNRASVFGTALDSAASIHRNQAWQIKDSRQYLFQACVHLHGPTLGVQRLDAVDTITHPIPTTGAPMK